MRERLKYWEMRARSLAPSWVRSAYRLARSAQTPQASQPLPPHLLRDCRFFASRIDLLEVMPHEGVVAEIGTYRGDYARAIFENTRPRELHLIDIDYTHFDERGLTDPRVTRHTGLAVETIAKFPDAYFDWIYIDADHSYAGARADAEASAAKVKPGGFLGFNDFCHIDPSLGRYGVHRAVVDFAIEHQWPFKVFAYQESAQYDVALQRPEGQGSGVGGQGGND